MPYSDATLPRFFNQDYVIYEDLDRQQYALNYMTRSIQRFLESNPRDLPDTVEIKALNDKSGTVKEEWRGYNEAERRQALEEWEAIIRAAHSKLNEVLLTASVPNAFYTDIIEHQAILNIKALLMRYSPLLLGTQEEHSLSENNALGRDMKEACFDIKEIHTLTVRFYEHIQTLLSYPNIEIDETSPQTLLANCVKPLEDHLHQVTQAQLKEREANDQRWHQNLLDDLKQQVDAYLSYIQSPDKAGEKNFTGFHLFDRKIELKLSYYRTSQPVKDRIRTLEVFRDYLKRQQSITPQLIHSVQTTLSDLIDNQVEKSDNTLSIEKEHYYKLTRTFFNLKEHAENKSESYIKYITDRYLAYLESVLSRQRRLAEQFIHQDNPKLVEQYKHWQIVKNRLSILASLSKALPTGHFSRITLNTLRHALDELRDNGIKEARFLLSTEEHYFRLLEDSISARHKLYDDQVFQDTKQLILQYRNYLVAERTSDISPDNQYAQLVKDYDSYLREQASVHNPSPISFETFVEKGPPNIFGETIPNAAPSRNTQFLRDKKAYEMKEGYKHFDVVKQRLNILNTLLEDIESFDKSSHHVASSIKFAITKLEENNVQDFDRVTSKEMSFYQQLKRTITRLQHAIKINGQEEIRGIVGRYQDFLEKKIKIKPKHPALNQEEDMSLLNGYTHWQVVKNRYDIVSNLYHTLSTKRLLTTKALKEIVDKAIEKLKTEGVQDALHVLPEETGYFDSLVNAIAAIAPSSQYIPFSHTIHFSSDIGNTLF